MITPMKKISIVLLDKEKEKSLKSLKKLGLMHLKEKLGTSDDVTTLNDEIKDIETALRFTDEAHADHKHHMDHKEIVSIIENINETGRKLNELEERESLLNRDIEFLGPWGDFNPSDITLLKEKGISISLLELSKDEMASFPTDVKFFNISHSNLGFLIAVVGECPSGFSEFEPPELGLEDSISSLDMVMDEIEKVQEELKSLSVYHGLILTYKEYLEDRVEFESVKAGMSIDETFSVLEGWIPTEKVENFRDVAAKNSWGYQIIDPVEGDETPTLLKGNKITSMIHPLLDFLGNVPGYWEKDVSPIFLVFFTIFFAMIIGDAGYGLLFLLGAVLINLKVKRLPSALALLYLISLATVGWGAITGNWFGSELIKGIPFFKGLILSQVDTGVEVMELCFNIAVVHIVIGRLLAFIKDMKDKKLSGIANLGWLTMTVGLIYLVRNLVISADYPVPTESLIAVAIGFAVVIVFGKQEKGQNFFKGIGLSLAFSPLTALDSVGEFGNIISYVRLYAVGLAGFAVAQSFNAMAAPLLAGGGPGYIGGALVLLGGHAFNIAMAILSVLVHGVRLNVLEFSGAADVNWTGRKFNPFREKQI